MRIPLLRLIGIVLASLLLCLVFFGPRLWLMNSPRPGTYQWARAVTFLKQCDEPFRHDIEPAMIWRLLPPVVCHTLGLTGYRAFLLPWIGALAATAYAAVLAGRRNGHWHFVFGCTLLFACSSSVLVPLHWFGMNDAWAWLGLLVFTFGQSRTPRLMALLLAPWVDERFLIALPLATLVRSVEQPPLSLLKEARLLFWILPYAAARVWFLRESTYLGPTTTFLAAQVALTPVVLPLAPMGWWMAWRAGWMPAVYAIKQRPWALGTATLATLLAGTVLAADLSRSAAMLGPLVLAGCFLYARDRSSDAPSTVLIIALANLLIPAAHVVYKTIDPVNPLALEMLRFFRIHG